MLDGYIEYIKNNTDNLVELKFFGQDKIIESPRNIMSYLSSSTIKGITIFERAYKALETGAYYCVDEIELHIHKTIVIKLIELFANNITNPHGAVIVFTTHYSEILDSIKRHDSIYIMQKEKNSIVPARMSDLFKRNDISNSRLYLSGVFNSAPSYEEYMNF